MVSLATLENRAIVALGLAELNRGPHHPGLQALLDVSGLTRGDIDEGTLGYRIGPRINAAGRVAEATLVVELLGTRDPERAKALATRLDGLNTERRDIQKRLVREALERIGDDPPPFVVLSGHEAEGWHRGVVGIVAARIKDQVNRPVAVVSIQGDLAVGSVRSIQGIHAVRALESVADLLVKFGGHPAAAGFTTRAADLAQLAERLSAYVAETLPSDGLVPVRRADARVAPEELTTRLLADLGRLGPFGSGNPSPALWVPGVRPFAFQVKGAEGNLLKFLVPRGGASAIEAVWWDHSDLGERLQQGPIDLRAGLSDNVWRGERRLQLEVRDARVAAA
jgi:single-stranded-DNA-specific exonuclease